MTNQVDICNRALLAMGNKQTVSQINPSDGSVEANSCSILFTPCFESLARVAQWDCLRTQKTLNLVMAQKGTPENINGTTLPVSPQPWKYAYSYPNDCIAVRQLFPIISNGSSQLNNFTSPTIDYSYLQDQDNTALDFVVSVGNDLTNNPIKYILTNLQNAGVIYTWNQPNPELWDSQFQEAMTLYLASKLVMALSANTQIFAGLESSTKAMIADARRTDGNEGSKVIDNAPDWLTVRGATGISGFSNTILGD
jgi:hypothetical protein